MSRQVYEGAGYKLDAEKRGTVLFIHEFSFKWLENFDDVFSVMCDLAAKLDCGKIMFTVENRAALNSLCKKGWTMATSIVLKEVDNHVPQ